ncbi:MAG: PIN domain-containing protein, partial [Chitinophagales bacterium]|nr:PIN domain-containing protein [Chitinophagales bacterium]
IEIRFNDLINAYSKIDAYSQGKLQSIPLKTSSRNMGKNDLWIAATTLITNAKLITMDKDFQHLNKEFFEVILIER